MRKELLILAGLGAGVLGLSYLMSRAQAQGTVVSAETTTGEVPVGSTFNVNIVLVTNYSVFADEITLNFNPSILSVESITEGNFLGQDGASTFPVIKIDNNAGKAVCGFTRMGVDTGVTGTGNLAVVVFKAKAVGSSYINPSSIKIVDITLNTVPVNKVNSINITVV
jgi:hypothetical protein